MVGKGFGTSHKETIHKSNNNRALSYKNPFTHDMPEEMPRNTVYKPDIYTFDES